MGMGEGEEGARRVLRLQPVRLHHFLPKLPLSPLQRSPCFILLYCLFLKGCWATLLKTPSGMICPQECRTACPLRHRTDQDSVMGLGPEIMAAWAKVRGRASGRAETAVRAGVTMTP